MIHITNEELRQLARASRLQVTQEEAQSRLIPKLEAVLSYASQLSAVRSSANASSQHRAAVMRTDSARPSPADTMLRQAPAQRERYLVVPVVIGAEVAS